jgi:hypothetical protein
MIMKRAGILLMSFILTLAVSKVWAQVTDQRQTQVRAITVKANQPRPDKKGTRMDTIYAFTIDWKDQGDAKRYTILYYLNGELQFEMENQTLPVEIKRNFKGQAAGDYEVKIELEDASMGSYNVVASDTVKIRVR